MKQTEEMHVYLLKRKPILQILNKIFRLVKTYFTEENRFASDLSTATKSTPVFNIYKITGPKYYPIFNAAVRKHLISANKIFR